MSAADQEMVSLLKGFDLQKLLCVPIVKAEEGSGYEGRLQNCLWSDPLDPSSADAAVEVFGLKPEIARLPNPDYVTVPYDGFVFVPTFDMPRFDFIDGQWCRR